MKVYKSGFIFFLLLVFNSCSNPKKGNGNKHLDTEIDIQKTKIIPQKKDSLDKSKLLELYSKSHSSDTVIPLLVYRAAKFRKEIGVEEYSAFESFDIDYKQYEKKLKKMFYFEESFDTLLIEINKRIQTTRKFNRKILLNDYQEYNSLEGSTFSYLSKVKDSFALTMTQRLFQNSKADTLELKTIAKYILDDYKDSTFVKITENW